jgi:hypothetical protein
MIEIVVFIAGLALGAGIAFLAMHVAGKIHATVQQCITMPIQSAIGTVAADVASAAQTVANDAAAATKG